MPHSVQVSFQHHNKHRNPVLVSANFVMLLRRCRIRYKDPTHLAVSCPIHLSQCVHAKPTVPCPYEESHQVREASRTPTQHPWSSCHHCSPLARFLSPCPLSCKYKYDIPKFEMLASLQRQLCLRLASRTLESQHNLLRSLCLLVENGLCLTTITGLFAIITTLSLREQRGLGLLDANRSREC